MEKRPFIDAVYFKNYKVAIKSIEALIKYSSTLKGKKTITSRQIARWLSLLKAVELSLRGSEAFSKRSEKALNNFKASNKELIKTLTQQLSIMKAKKAPAKEKESGCEEKDCEKEELMRMMLD